MPLKRIVGMKLDPGRLLYVNFKPTGKTRKLLGYTCRDYSGVKRSGPLMLATTACFSTNAPGSGDLTNLIKSISQQSKRVKATSSIPAGMPLVIEASFGIDPSFTPPDTEPKAAAEFKRKIATIPPQITREEVTKVTSVKLSPDVFEVPAGYTRRGRKLD
jgi:hypothetical protein